MTGQEAIRAESVVVRSPAKVNWLLRVGPSRPDGFHTVHTAMVALDWCDRLEIELDAKLAPGHGELQIHGPAGSADIPLDERNLVVRAWQNLPEAWQARLRTWPSGWRVRLEKRIPSRAGLGGGSSNAAAVLAGLSRMGGWAMEPEVWEPVLASLGSDCVFFGHLLMGEAAQRGARAGWLVDRGQLWQRALTPETMPSHWSVITPEVTCATGAVYGAFDQIPGADAGPQAWRAGFWPQRENHLQPAALTSHPALVPWAACLEELAPQAFQLAGSGASFYAPIPAGGDPSAWHQNVLEGLERAGRTVRHAWWGPSFVHEGPRVESPGTPNDDRHVPTRRSKG